MNPMAPSPGQKAVTCLPFLISCIRTHFLMAEFGCLASTPTFSRTMPQPAALLQGSALTFSFSTLRL